MQLLPLGGTTRLPSLAALGWIIAYYVEFGKRGRPSPPPAGAPPPRGEARGAVGRNPPSAFGGVPPFDKGG